MFLSTLTAVIMYPTDNIKNGQLKFVKHLDHNIMLKTLQNLCYNKTTNFNMSSPFLVDNILHQQKNDFHNQYLNQQIENYMQRQNYSRENTPEVEETKHGETEDENREESTEDTKIENDEDSKSRDEEEPYSNVKNELYFNNDYYQGPNDGKATEKEVLNIPSLSRRCHICGHDCPPFACKKSGIRRLEELEKRFSLNGYQDNSGDEAERDGKPYTTEDMVREEYSEQKKPLLKFSVSAILGDREDSPGKNCNVGGKL